MGSNETDSHAENTQTNSSTDDAITQEDITLDYDTLTERLAEAEAKSGEHWDALLRAKAELENVRRSAQRDIEKAHKFGLERLFQELLPVKDSLEMGLEAAQNEEADVAKLREGTELTLKMLIDLMNKFDIDEINPLGEPFNPEFHQAMSMLESDKQPPNTVLTVMQKGYTLNERLIRPAMVVVSKAPETSASQAGNSDS